MPAIRLFYPNRLKKFVEKFSFKKCYISKKIQVEGIFFQICAKQWSGAKEVSPLIILDNILITPFRIILPIDSITSQKVVVQAVSITDCPAEPYLLVLV